MTEGVIIALISAVGLVLSGVLVELVRARKRHELVVHEVTPNSGSSMRDVVNRIEASVEKVRESQITHGERLAKVEAKIENWSHPNRRATDGR